MGQEKPRRHSHEFRVEIARRILAGECVSALSERYQLPRSMMYRWRNAYRKDGPEGLRPIGRPPGSASKPATVTKRSTEQQLRQRVAELERKIGQQSVEIDFL